MKKDELFEILKRKIDNSTQGGPGQDEILSETVAEYLERLLLRGHIPAHFVEAIEADLREEATEMYKKKTYGYMDLNSYKTAQKTKSKSRQRST